MKVRLIDKPEITGNSSQFNVHALAEVFVGFDNLDYGYDTCYIKDFDVFVEATQEWKTMSDAFRDHDIVTDNMNSVFFEPKKQEDRERGYTYQ